jgi:hypothetical protein
MNLLPPHHLLRTSLRVVEEAILIYCQQVPIAHDDSSVDDDRPNVVAFAAVYEVRDDIVHGHKTGSPPVDDDDVGLAPGPDRTNLMFEAKGLGSTRSGHPEHGFRRHLGHVFVVTLMDERGGVHLLEEIERVARGRRIGAEAHRDRPVEQVLNRQESEVHHRSPRYFIAATGQ